MNIEKLFLNNDYFDELLDIYQNHPLGEGSATRTTRIFCERYNIPFGDTLRKRAWNLLYNYESNSLDVINKPKEDIGNNISSRSNNKNVLVIGDLHSPFILDGYLEHCIKTYHRYECDTVVFIGDVIDSHYSSYHETDPDGYSAGEELERAINQLKNWYKAFPNAKVTIGNHDLLVNRKAMTAGLSSKWIKSYSEVLETPGWEFVEDVEIDGVLYTHGSVSAMVKAKRDLCSVVSGHLHTRAGVEWFVGKNFKIFGMQTGCGIDNKAYAMAYSKNFSKPAIGCAVVLKGTQPFNVMMDL